MEAELLVRDSWGERAEINPYIYMPDLRIYVLHLPVANARSIARGP